MFGVTCVLPGRRLFAADLTVFVSKILNHFLVFYD